MMNALPAGPRFCSASLPRSARPITVMITPSLANQLAPRTSSMEETDFMRCSSVGFGGGTRSGEIGGGDETRAAAAGGTAAGEVCGTAGEFGTAVGEIIFGGATGGAGFGPEGGASVAGASGFGSSGATG